MLQEQYSLEWYAKKEKEVKSAFSFPVEYYQRQRKTKPLNTYYEDKVKYLVDVMNIEEDKAKEFVANLIRTRKKEPLLYFYDRDEKTKDKAITQRTLTDYINSTYARDDIIVPSFTKYFKHHFALDAEWTDDKVANRNAMKNKKKFAEQSGNDEDARSYNNKQLSLKTAANSLSGLSSIKAAPIHTFSIHYSLTSTTRVTASTGINYGERMFGGNRNWISEEDALSDLITHSKYFIKSDVEEMQKIHKLKIPTPAMIREYVHDKTIGWEHTNANMGLTKLQRYITSRSDLEKVYIFYAMDFVTLFKYNPEFAKKFLSDFSRRPADVGGSKDIEVLNSVSYNVQNMMYMINNDLMVGKPLSFNNYKDTALGDIFMGTYKSIILAMDNYKWFIKSMFKNVECTPRYLAKTKFMIKTASVLSDTDSVCPLTHKVLKKDMDPNVLSPYNIRLMAPLVLFLSEKLLHGFGIYTSLTNAKPEKHGKISMKAEYIWSTFIPASKAKHYTVVTHQQEFFVKPKGDISSSGVHLIAGKMSPVLTELYNDFKEEVVREIEFYGKVNFNKLMKKACALEARVAFMIIKDPRVLLPLEMIKPAEEYANFKKDGVKSTDAFHKVMYDKHFKPFFGDTPSDELPQLYTKVYIKKLSNRHNNNKEMYDRLGIPMDESFVNPMEKFKLEDKKPPSSIRIPRNVMESQGMPKEWLANIDILETLNKSFNGFYNFMASLGISKNDNQFLFQTYGTDG